MADDYAGEEGSGYPDYVLKYFERRGYDPEELDKLPHVRTFFEHVSREGIEVLDDVGDALEKDVPRQDDDEYEDAVHDPAKALKSYVFVIH